MGAIWARNDALCIRGVLGLVSHVAFVCLEGEGAPSFRMVHCQPTS